MDRTGLFHAIRADLLRRLDRPDAAHEAYERAIGLAENQAERRFLERQDAEVIGPHGS